MAVASAESYANNLHLTPDNHTNTSSLDFYMPDALLDTQPSVSKHGRKALKAMIKTKFAH